jgi:hypothetical protein
LIVPAAIPAAKIAIISQAPKSAMVPAASEADL